MAMPSDLRLNGKANGTVIRFDESLLPVPVPDLFDVDWLRSNQHFRGSARGRGKAYFLQYGGVEMVLRHFQRGGLIAKINRDLYLRCGAHQSRPFREFDLLAEMHAEGLSVPRPVAARYIPFGPAYRADIITERIPGARPLEDVLCDRAVSSRLWGAIGAAVRDLHDHKVFHSDLNCRNIMIDADDRVWFIDFDKCEKRNGDAWMRANLDRLHRSLVKMTLRLNNVHWCQKDWADLLAGYKT